MSVRFGHQTALRTGAINFHSGTTVALMGPNGSGKTTLLRVVAGLQTPSSGTVNFGSGFVAAYVAQHQHQHQWMPLTVAEVLSIGRYRTLGLLRRFGASDRALVADAAEQLKVSDLLDRPFSELSGGQRQRVLVAAAVANNASCLLLDEPITGLDLPSQQIILDVVDQQKAEGRLVIMSTHHMEEARHCDRVVLLKGSVVADGSPAEVLSPKHLAAAFGPAALTINTGTDRGQDGASLIMMDDHGHGHLPTGQEVQNP